MPNPPPENKESGNDGAFRVTAKYDLKDNRRFKHPWNGSPELAKRAPQWMGRCVGHGVLLDRLKPAFGLGPREAARLRGPRWLHDQRLRFQDTGGIHGRGTAFANGSLLTSKSDRLNQT
jgi:hypothetical protein